MSETRVFSGMQPTGEAHLGNYLGALRQWVRLQDQADCIYCIVDYHAITLPYDVAELPARTLEMAISFLAAGLDPDRCTLFVQSAVPEHTELAWIFNTVTPLGEGLVRTGPIGVTAKLGPANLAPDQRTIFFATVKKLGEEAAAAKDWKEAIVNYTLYSQSEASGKETLRQLAQMYENDGQVLPFPLPDGYLGQVNVIARPVLSS